jgi:hypothetical protein
LTSKLGEKRTLCRVSVSPKFCALVLHL